MLLVPLVLEAFPEPNILPNIENLSCLFPSICISIATVTLMKLKSYTSLPEAFASPPPTTVPPISIFPISKLVSPTASYPILV